MSKLKKKMSLYRVMVWWSYLTIIMRITSGAYACTFSYMAESSHLSQVDQDRSEAYSWTVVSSVALDLSFSWIDRLQQFSILRTLSDEVIPCQIVLRRTLPRISCVSSPSGKHSGYLCNVFFVHLRNCFHSQPHCRIISSFFILKLSVELFRGNQSSSIPVRWPD